MATIRVRAVGGALVTDCDAMENGVRRFIGRKIDPEKGGFVPLDEPAEVSARAEHVQAVRDGDLDPADAETAARCGVAWKVAKKAKES